MPQRSVSVFDRLSPILPRIRQAQPPTPRDSSRDHLGLKYKTKLFMTTCLGIFRLEISVKGGQNRPGTMRDHLNYLRELKAKKMKILMNHKALVILMMMTTCHFPKGLETPSPKPRSASKDSQI